MHSLDFKPLNIEADFALALQYRRDSYQISFATEQGFWEEVGQDGEKYRSKMEARQLDTRWAYVHVWHQDQIIGQLEFHNYSDWPDCGYVNLFYLLPEWRGQGLFQALQNFIVGQLAKSGCTCAILSASRSNQRALHAYQKHGWEFFAANPKHPLMDYYRLQFPPQRPAQQ